MKFKLIPTLSIFMRSAGVDRAGHVAIRPLRAETGIS